MRRYLRAVAIAAETLPQYPGGAEWQNLLFEAAVALDMRTNRRSFAAIYLAFIGRDERPACRLAPRIARQGVRRATAPRSGGRHASDESEVPA